MQCKAVRAFMSPCSIKKVPGAASSPALPLARTRLALLVLVALRVAPSLDRYSSFSEPGARACTDTTHCQLSPQPQSCQAPPEANGRMRAPIHRNTAWHYQSMVAHYQPDAVYNNKHVAWWCAGMVMAQLTPLQAQLCHDNSLGHLGVGSRQGR